MCFTLRTNAGRTYTHVMLEERTEEFSKSKGSGTVFGCVGLRGPSPLWYTHLAVFLHLQRRLLSTAHLHGTMRVGVQGFKSVWAAHFVSGIYTFLSCQLCRRDFHTAEGWRRVYACESPTEWSGPQRHNANNHSSVQSRIDYFTGYFHQFR